MIKVKPIVGAMLLALAAALPGTPAAAQDVEVPYWASLRVDKVNMRVGPGEDYRIAWVYRRVDLPVKVLRLKEGWRLVQDPAGVRGWMLARFLKRERGAIVQGQGLTEMRDSADAGARLLWKVEPGVIGKLGECVASQCRLTVGAHSGFVPQDRLWGAGEP